MNNAAAWAVAMCVFLGGGVAAAQDAGLEKAVKALKAKPRPAPKPKKPPAPAPAGFVRRPKITFAVRAVAKPEVEKLSVKEILRRSQQTQSVCPQAGCPPFFYGDP